ncbi:nuclear transport factor 2 family protein [Sphingobium estronivorans]|uniref:nuclear transport factor 2 family protein n=1 Tax=Sphingobium estronivorans TaxID=1577690 RepID=UPI0013C2F420|nr:nuclear transport factor 2 family protein [Sphingobium estronivorans]
MAKGIWLVVAALAVLPSTLYAGEVHRKGGREDASTVEKRLSYIEDRLALNDIEAEYARRYDAGDCDGWASLFDEDGVFEIVGVGTRTGQNIRGRKALLEFCSKNAHAQPGLHYFQPPSITVDLNEAVAEIRTQWVTAQGGSDRHIHNHTFSVVRVSYRRAADGWRILHRQTKLFADAGQ